MRRTFPDGGSGITTIIAYATEDGQLNVAAYSDTAYYASDLDVYDPFSGSFSAAMLRSNGSTVDGVWHESEDGAYTLSDNMGTSMTLAVTNR